MVGPDRRAGPDWQLRSFLAAQGPAGPAGPTGQPVTTLTVVPRRRENFSGIVDVAVRPQSRSPNREPIKDEASHRRVDEPARKSHACPVAPRLAGSCGAWLNELSFWCFLRAWAASPAADCYLRAGRMSPRHHRTRLRPRLSRLRGLSYIALRRSRQPTMKLASMPISSPASMRGTRSKRNRWDRSPGPRGIATTKPWKGC